MANQTLFLRDLTARCSSSRVEVRFLHFCEARNVCRSGELIGVDMIFINYQVVKKDEDVKAIVVCDDDWWPQSPNVVFYKSKELIEESTIKALRWKKMRLISFTKTVVDTMQEHSQNQLLLRHHQTY